MGRFQVWVGPQTQILLSNNLAKTALGLSQDRTANKSPRSLGSSRRFGRLACSECPPGASCRWGRTGSGARRRVCRRRGSTRWFQSVGSFGLSRWGRRACGWSASVDRSAMRQFFNFLWPTQCIEEGNLIRFIRYEGPPQRTTRGDTRWIAVDQQSGTAV